MSRGTDWLSDFVAYATYGEASPRLMYWVAVSTLAGVLRRKVWFDQDDYQWSPNFYILVVGEPGLWRKSTSIGVGMRLLKQVPGINMGPNISTWQALIEKLEEVHELWRFASGQEMEMSSMTLDISEFGSFFDPTDRNLADNLTDLWDNRADLTKITKTSGNNYLVNPWINLIAATTPKWLSTNFSDSLVGGGLAGRFIILSGEMPTKDVAYPKRLMPGTRPQQRRDLVERLCEIAKYEGEMELTEAAYEWGTSWYEKERNALRAHGAGSLEAGFMVRKQCHLHKLAMVISAARQKFPIIDVAELEEADRQLAKLDNDTRKVFGVVGQSPITQAAREIADTVERLGQIERRKLYREKFFRTMRYEDFEAAVRAAIQAELILEASDVAHPILMVRKGY